MPRDLEAEVSAFQTPVQMLLYQKMTGSKRVLLSPWTARWSAESADMSRLELLPSRPLEASTALSWEALSLMTCRRARAVASLAVDPFSQVTVFGSLFGALVPETTRSFESDSKRASMRCPSSCGAGGMDGRVEVVGSGPCSPLAV